MEKTPAFYTRNPFLSCRRLTREVSVGGTVMGGGQPVRIQSMANIPTMETEACVRQIIRLAEAGSEYVRVTAPRMEEGRNLAVIKKRLEEEHCHVPIVADVHFTPDVAEVAAEIVEKVRINPGNYTDRKILTEYSDKDYREALEKTADKLVRLLKICQRNGTALRVGVNHGSLSPRIVSRYGDTPLGMAMSAMEFLEICEDYGFRQTVVSMKASNVRIMTESVRLLVAMADAKGWNVPIHLGVTEAGNGAYGRIKSTAGILPLLYDGIGDTIRISLTEAPENEIPVARLLAGIAEERCRVSPEQGTDTGKIAYDPYRFTRRTGTQCGTIGGGKTVVISGWEGRNPEDLPEAALAEHPHVTPTGQIPDNVQAIVLETTGDNPPLKMRHFFNRLITQGCSAPVIIRRHYTDTDWNSFAAKATADYASIFIEGWGDGIWICNPNFPQEKIYNLSLQILQACGIRFNQAEYIACPSCGRTQYRIEEALEEIKRRTCHLRNLKIGVMGCIVNGPGEMADADYGFVGCGGGKVSLYKGKQPVYHQVPQEKGIDMLIQLIKENGDWTEPAR
ncbi:MAG: (E)-4-hydroxy-3-methylbut-2-enyl-diphosphate synthase [Bacteroidales bacterium]|nr:(E)-4-hydroxy-3-methylbut-2-enyl-diphosphate synthase [Bacteroidales bacterium]